MRLPQRALIAFVLVLGLGSTGCAQVFKVVVGVAAIAALEADYSHIRWSSVDSSIELNRPVHRSMTQCELERSRWRETHQDQDTIPPEKECTEDGSYAALLSPPPPLPTLPPAAKSVRPPAEPPIAPSVEAPAETRTEI